MQKNKKTNKKAFALLSGFCMVSAGIAAVTPAIISQQNTTVSTTLTNNNYNEVASNVIEPNEIVSNQANDQLLLAVTQKQISTINGQEIVNAIESFNNSDLTNDSSNAFTFEIQEQSNVMTSLISNIQQNIKYFSNDSDDPNIYTLPQSAISINQESNNYMYHVFIDLTKINGFINYYQNYNPSLFDKNQIDYANNQLITNNQSISFNAIAANEINIEPTKNLTLQIVSLCAIILGSIGLMLIIILISKKLLSKNKVVEVY